jgi:hypothetical protein
VFDSQQVYIPSLADDVRIDNHLDLGASHIRCNELGLSPHMYLAVPLAGLRLRLDFVFSRLSNEHLNL